MILRQIVAAVYQRGRTCSSLGKMNADVEMGQICLRCVGNLGWLETALRGRETDLVLPFLSEKSPFWITVCRIV